MKRIKSELLNILLIIIITFIIFFLIHNVCGSSIFDHSPYDSYERQALAWLNGETHLPENYSWLELAIYEDNYYVSFPPFPSVFMLPFVMIFGENTPNNFIIFSITVLNCIIAYFILRKQGTRENTSIMIAMGLVFGSNMMSMALNGGVWFIAQALNMLLCTIAVYGFLYRKKILMYFCLALAVGCRPFSAIFIIAVFVYFCIKDDKRPKAFLKNNILPLIPVIIIALVYMWYNYVRFDNPFEFGHNYLPEFTDSEFGQFNLIYLKDNLKQLLCNAIEVDENMHLFFPMPFMFFIANPFFVVSAYHAIKNIVKSHSISITRMIFTLGMAINIICLCLHKTLGGWQFGARYTCDFLPFAFLCFLISKKKNEEIETGDNNSIKLLGRERLSPVEIDQIEIIYLLFGIVLNIFGAIELWTHR